MLFHRSPALQIAYFSITQHAARSNSLTPNMCSGTMMVRIAREITQKCSTLIAGLSVTRKNTKGQPFKEDTSVYPQSFPFTAGRSHAVMTVLLLNPGEERGSER